MPAPPRPPRLSPFAALGWLTTVAALAFGVPLFLQLPPWCDLTLYQVAARNLLDGGVLYRDVFDTNLPGFVWAVAAIQAVFGESVVAIRVVDLVVVAAAAALLAGHARRAAGTPASVAWFAAAVALFYPLTSEFNHAQRDVWMLLPAAAATRLRLAGKAPFAEGFLWGAAVWVKPHVAVPALAVWLASARTRPPGGSLGTLPLLAGGLVMGALGLAAIWLNGAWADFVEVMTVWNPEYTAGTLDGVAARLPQTFQHFAPWSLLHLAALPLAVAYLWRGRRPAPPARPRALLAALYLGWVLQALVIQRGFEYAHAPETLIAFALLAAARVPVGLVGLALVGLQLAVATTSLGRVLPESEYLPVDVPRLADRAAWVALPKCLGPGSPELRDEVKLYNSHCVPGWADLAAVEAYLRAVDPPLADGDLLCFHDSPHPLYLFLGLKPATRYLHFGTALGVRTQQPRITAEVRAAAPRYVVSDLKRLTWTRGAERAPSRSDGLPAWLPLSQRNQFPWDQPVAFRHGRYVVHRVTHPIGEVDIPDWLTLDRLGPGAESR
jgi:hypothetical protein